MITAILSMALSSCGEVSDAWHEERIPDSDASAAAQTAGSTQDGVTKDAVAGGGTATNTAQGTIGTNTAAAGAGATPMSATGNATAGPSNATNKSSTNSAANSNGATAVNAASATGDFKPAGYDTLFFSDEFNGSELDRSKWCTRYRWGGGPPLQIPDAQCTEIPGQGTLDYANADEQQRFRDINSKGEPLHVLSNGTMKLRATKTGPNDYLRFEAAMVSSKITFRPEGNTSYYITTRMKLPNVLGTWPSIWLAGSISPDGTSQWPPEIDIFEGPLNNNPDNEFTLVQHSQIRGGKQTNSGKYEFTTYDENYNSEWGFYTSPDRSLRVSFIEIAAEWTTDTVCYFIDGLNTACENYRWVDNDGNPANPANVLINLAIGGPWAGRGGIDDAAFPTQLEVDYVRVYRKN